MIPNLETFLNSRTSTITSVPQDQITLNLEHKQRLANWLARPQPPKVSVLMALFNSNPEHLTEAIASVWHQTYPNVELILVDDASTSEDHLSEVFSFAETSASQVESLNSRSVRIFRNPKNLGIAGARNTAFSMSSGAFICIVDHDDIIHPFALDLLVEKLLSSNATFQYSFECKLKEDGVSYTQFLSKPNFSMFTLLHYNYICHLTIIQRELLDELILADGEVFRRGFDGAEDHDLFLRLSTLKNFKPGVVPLFLYYWRMSPTSTAQSDSNKPLAILRSQIAAKESIERAAKKVNFEFRSGAELFIHRSHSCLTLKKRWFRRGSKVSIIFFGAEPPTQEQLELWQRQKDVQILSHCYVNSPAERLVDYRTIDRKIRDYIHSDTVLIVHSGVNPLQPESLYQLSSWLHLFPDTGTVTASLIDLLHFPDLANSAADSIWGIGGYRFKPKLGYAGFPRLETRADKSSFVFESHETLSPSVLLISIDPKQYIKAGGFRYDLFANRLADLDLGLRLRRLGFRPLNIGGGFFSGTKLFDLAFGDNAPEEAHLVEMVSQQFDQSIFQLGYDHAYRAYYGWNH